MLNFLDYIYFYGIKQEFYINHSDKYSTLFSSILSFITYFLVCFFLFYFGRNIVFKKNPDFNQLQVNYDNPDLINLENENFLFAFAVQDSNYTNYIDPTIYEVEAFYVKISQDPITKNKTKNINSLELIPCNKLNITFQNDFIKLLSLSQLFCLNNLKNTMISGGYLMENWNYVSIHLKLCNNSKHCKSKEEIKEYLKGGYFGIFTSDISVDPENYNKPVSLYGINSYTSILPNMNKDIWVYIKNIDIVTDDGIFFPKKKKENYHGFDKITECTSDNINSDYTFMKIMIRSSSSKIVYTRNYKKIGTIFADISACSKLIVIFGKILSNLVDRVYYRHYILSFFDSNERKLKKYLTTKNNQSIHFKNKDNTLIKQNNYLGKPRLCLPDLSPNQDKKSLSINLKKQIMTSNIKNSGEVSQQFLLKKNSFFNSLIENKYLHSNKMKEIKFYNLIKKIVCEKKEILLNFRNISIYFEVIRYLKIFKELHIIQKTIFEKSEKLKIELNYNLRKNSDIVDYIYKNKLNPFYKIKSKTEY